MMMTNLRDRFGKGHQLVVISNIFFMLLSFQLGLQQVAIAQNLKATSLTVLPDSTLVRPLVATLGQQSRIQ